MRINKLLAAVVLAVIVAAVFAAYTVIHSPHAPGAATSVASGGSARVTPQATTTMVGARHRVTIRDLEGRSVTLTVPVERVVLIDGGSTGYIVAIDAVAGVRGLRSIVGLDLSEWKRTSPQLYHLYTEAHPWLAHVADIGSSHTRLDIKKIIALKPDVVIAPPYAFTRLRETGGLQELEKAGIPVVVIDFHSGEWSRTGRSIELLGVLFGTEERAENLANWYREHLELVLKRVHDLNKPLVYIEAGYRRWYTWGSDYMWGRLVELAGGKNIAGGLFAQSGVINPKYLVEAGPEVVVVTGGWWSSGGPRLGPSVTRREAVESLEAWVNRTTLLATPALRHYRVCSVYHAFVHTVWDVLGLEFLAKAIHPAAMRDVNVTRDLVEFFKKFLSVPFRGTWFVCLEPPRHTVTVTDGLGRRVTLEVPVRRIAVMYGLEDLVAVGGEEALAKLVALNKFRYEKWRPDWWYMWRSHFPWVTRLPDIGQPGYGLNIEAIIESRPDVLIVAPFMYKKMLDSGDVERLEKAGVKILVVNFVPETTNVTQHLEAVKRSILALGEITGYTDRAERLVKLYEAKLHYVISHASRANKTSVLVLATWAKWRAYGAKSMYEVWIKFANGVNIAARAVPGSSGSINPELVLEANPDVIIFTCNNNLVTSEGVRQVNVIGYTVPSPEPAKKALRQLIDRPGWSKLKAVKECRVYMLYHGLSHGHIFQYVALEYIAKWLHPGVFAELNPRNDLASFFAKYMPFPLRGVWGVGLCDP